MQELFRMGWLIAYRVVQHENLNVEHISRRCNLRRPSIEVHITIRLTERLGESSQFFKSQRVCHV